MTSMVRISLNVINLWKYKLIIVVLTTQISMIVFIMMVEIIVKSDEGWLSQNIWLSFLIASIFKFIIQQGSFLILFFQIFEWFTIYFMIRFESMSAMRTVIFKNYNKNDDQFNINEIKAKKFAFAFFVLNFSISSWIYAYKFKSSLDIDLGYYDGTDRRDKVLDYNLKFLSLQL